MRGMIFLQEHRTRDRLGWVLTLCSPQTPAELTKLALQSGELEVFQQEDPGWFWYRNTLPMGEPRYLAVCVSVLAGNKHLSCSGLCLDAAGIKTKSQENSRTGIRLSVILT